MIADHRRIAMGRLITSACDRGRGWAAVSVVGSVVTYCYPISISARKVTL